VLLPIYLQTLMGYTATLAGMVLGPGGMATLFSMPLAGRLITKINPKYLLGFGLLVAAYATHLMAQFSLQADFSTIILPRIILGVGLGFLFIPLTTTTMSGIPNENMGNASAIFNLVRNLGGSFGVAFVTTLLARRTQFHHSRLVEGLTPFDRAYQSALNHALPLAPSAGADAATGTGMIYRQLLRQASMMSFNDAFYLLSIFLVCLVPLVLLMKMGKVGGMVHGE
jgi:DHA2 family multidrug resistance protein